MTSLSARDLIGLLAARHSGEVFVTECKNGPTHSSSNLLKLDAWVMPKSWAHYTTIGYEVKVSRSDFTQDQKWIGYLDYCHEFYFVCPAGLIKSSELPKGVGLLWATSNGTRLLTKHKSESREPDPAKLLDLFSYVLMCRTRVVTHEYSNDGHDVDARLAQHRRVTERALERKELASFVAEHIRAAFDEKASELGGLKEQIEVARALRTHLEEAGVPWPETHWSDWKAKDAIDRKIGKLDPKLITSLKQSRSALDRMIGEFEAQGAAQ